VCKIANKTKSYISRSNVHWKIRGKLSCGTTFSGNTSSAKGRRGGERCWSGSIVNHRSVGDGKAQQRAMEMEKQESEVVVKRKWKILDRATLLEKGIKISNLERFMWTETKQNYDKHVERMENWKGIWRTPRSLMDSTMNPKEKELGFAPWLATLRG
jgi:hypothetical protein